MNAPMRMAPSCSIFGATSTSTSARATGSSVRADRDHRRDATERRADEHRRLGQRRWRSRTRRRRTPRGRSRRRRASRSRRDRAGRRGTRASRARRAPARSTPTRSGSDHRRAAARPAGRRDRRTRRRAVAGRRARGGRWSARRRCWSSDQPPGERGHRVAADVLVRDVAVGRPLAGHAQHALGDEVALDLVAAAGEARAPGARGSPRPRRDRWSRRRSAR